MDSNSFTEATGRVLRILPKLYAGTIRMQYAQEHGMLSEANMLAFENYRHAEALALCYRAIPTYTGLPYAKKEVQRIMSEEVPFEIGYTDEGWFCVRFPRMLPKKERAVSSIFAVSCILLWSGSSKMSFRSDLVTV